MVATNNPLGSSGAGDMIVAWNEKFATGIDVIDEQHKHLFDLTNELYRACKLGGEQLDTVFKETMSRMVDYVKFHFTTEQHMLEMIHYAKYAEHKSEHDTLIRTVLETTRNYGDKKRFVPNNFVRFLKDWIVGHIGYSDKMYAAFVHDQQKKGALSDHFI